MFTQTLPKIDPMLTSRQVTPQSIYQYRLPPYLPPHYIIHASSYLLTHHISSTSRFNLSTHLAQTYFPPYRSPPSNLAIIPATSSNDDTASFPVIWLSAVSPYCRVTLHHNTTSCHHTLSTRVKGEKHYTHIYMSMVT